MRVSPKALAWAIKWERFDNTGDAWLDLRDARALIDALKIDLEIQRHHATKYEDQLKIAKAAGQDLYDNIGGHDHLDKQGNHGATCPVCIQQRDARERYRQALEQLK